MLLVYYRMYLTCEMVGYLFGLYQSSVSRNIRYLETSSETIPSKLSVDSKKINDIQQLHEFFSELIVMVHGTEQPIPRPQKSYQKKDTLFRQKHTVQNQITINLKMK